MSRRDLLAAGGVLWRPADPRSSADGTSVPNGRIDVALVHRPRYDDWSLPKGKVDSGEHPVEAAVREIAEETGHRAVLGRELGRTTYRIAAGEKTVRYWAARASGGEFRPGAEVDELAWLPPDAALARLTHAHDAGPLRRLLAAPGATTSVLLVRHGRAGVRAAWHGDDRLRPLDAGGARQAERLACVLAAFGPRRVYSADRVRCVQTVEPLARELGVPVELEPAFNEEAYAEDPGRAQRRLLALAAAGPLALCSQGGAVPALVRGLAEEAGLPALLRASRDGRPPARKGSAWVLTLAGSRLLAADYLPDAEPVEPVVPVGAADGERVTGSQDGRRRS